MFVKSFNYLALGVFEEVFDSEFLALGTFKPSVLVLSYFVPSSILEFLVLGTFEQSFTYGVSGGGHF